MAKLREKGLIRECLGWISWLCLQTREFRRHKLVRHSRHLVPGGSCSVNSLEKLNVGCLQSGLQARVDNRSFVESAALYDAICSFKNYSRECDRLRSVIDNLVPGARTLLDVACGTGEHARFLKHYYAVDGVDINESYLGATRLKNPSGEFTCADLMNIDLGRTYDVVTYLFSEIRIVGTFEGLERAIGRRARHVRPGGVLIIEPWFHQSTGVLQSLSFLLERLEARRSTA